MAFTTEEEAKVRAVLNAFDNAKRIDQLPIAEDIDPFAAIVEILDSAGESRQAKLLGMLPNVRELFAYGAELDSTVANPQLKRVGNPELHAESPIHSGMRCCLLNDDGTVNYYLDENDRTLREDGEPSNLDGTDGQVMVEIPAHYRNFKEEGTKYRAWLSEYALPGFHFVPKCYVSAYEATVDRTNSSAPKLASVVNLTPAFRGGGNIAEEIAHDADGGSSLGKPATTISLTNFRTYARRRGAVGKNGAGWNCSVYDIQKTIFWLYVVEYANLNSQAAYNAQPDANGHKQGGLGAGVTDLTAANITAMTGGTESCIPCGITNSLGNKTGIVAYTMPAEYGATKTTNVPSYRGIENPFGHIIKWMDGCKARIQSDTSGGLSEFFVCNEPDKFQDDDYKNYEKRGNLTRVNGFVKEIIGGEFGENMPKVAGVSSSSTYFCDETFISTVSTGESKRDVRIGGRGSNGAAAGFTSMNLAASNTGSYTGSRLCFIPE
jgi:hypothetical protein